MSSVVGLSAVEAALPPEMDERPEMRTPISQVVELAQTNDVEEAQGQSIFLALSHADQEAVARFVLRLPYLWPDHNRRALERELNFAVNFPVAQRRIGKRIESAKSGDRVGTTLQSDILIQLKISGFVEEYPLAALGADHVNSLRGSRYGAAAYFASDGQIFKYYGTVGNYSWDDLGLRVDQDGILYKL